MTGHRGFTSVFAAELDAYVTFKENMGFTGASRIWYLKQFDAYCSKHELTVFDKDTVEGWVSDQLQRCGRYRSWMSYIRDFGRWLRTNGVDDAYVLSDQWKAPFVPAHPYLLTRREIDLFFAAAAHFERTVTVAVAGGRVLPADALVRAADRRDPRPADRAGRPGRRTHRHRLVQGHTAAADCR